uniref:Integrase catalytic domain-containing protein n=1 Tax=Tanacetum cinerariifolium TaxID=118510 RepID=A0A6L2N205_TANCI|nr:hypothetical protein [Tanacetum cinerariifolium]
MKGYIDNLERLGNPVTLGLGVSLILIGLRKEYDGFVQNYSMHSMRKTVNELHAMLKLHEQTLPKSNTLALHAIRAGKVQKDNKRKKSHSQTAAKGQNHGKGKNKQTYAPKPKIPPLPKRENPTKDSICHEKLKPGALSLYVGNGQREAVEAIGAFYLCLPSGLEIVLNNCHYAPSITKGVIFVFRLYEDDFVNRFMDNTIQVSMNNVVYFNAIPRDGIFEIGLSNSLINKSSIYVVSNKRAKLDLDSTLLAFEKCVSCMSGEMARKPYTHQVERAKDLLGLIHTDVCGPFKIMSRQGASYFVTFTDDFSCYGYVYLLKHKHEVFETFKVFQKEVDNQLGKTIKSLRSDRGGEYMSQEFLDHLKDHRIIAHRTPPYTPQHNGVSERRNRTLLDMVRSMMSQKTLPKFFWDYTLEIVAHILNMVPTKNVEKIPYEVWHGKAPKLSYLKVWVDTQRKRWDVLSTTHPRTNTSLNHEEDDLEIDEPQSDIVPIRRSTRTRHAPDRMCLHIDAEEHELGDLGELANYKAALLDPKTVGSKWLFKKKTDMDGNVHIYKARLVAKGYTQTPGINYEETFSLVADIKAIRILIAIAAYYNYEIWQMDVKTAFLNGYLNEEQASRQWNKQFDDEIKKFGFTQNHDERCVYLKASGSNITFLILYVDDILIIRNSIPMLQSVKTYLGKCFAMKDLGEAAYILGIKIYRDRSKRLIGLCQSAYIEKILKRYCMENSKRRSIPMQEKLKLSKSQGASTPAELKRMQNVPYALANLGDINWTTVKNILKYLRNTKDMFLVYEVSTGYAFVLIGGAVDWKSAKQSIFATSTVEAEYIAAFDASKEAVWVRKFISGLGVVLTIEEPISMYCENTEAIDIANESGITKGARHFHVKVHYLREIIEFGDIKLEKVHTDDNLAGPFTKALSFPKHSIHTRNIGMLPASSLM